MFGASDTPTSRADGFCIDRLPMGRIRDALISPGAIALPLLHDHYRQRLLAEARLYRYRAARKEVGRDHEQVQQRMDVEPNFRDNSIFHELTRNFSKLFARSLDEDNPFDGDVQFNDLMLQRYTPGEIGITPHRDRTAYRYIVVLIVLCGRGRFCVSADRDAQDSVEIPNGPGDMILMRAPGFVDQNGVDLPRPFHFVHRITEPRYVFGLRDDLDKRPNAGVNKA